MNFIKIPLFICVGVILLPRQEISAGSCIKQKKFTDKEYPTYQELEKRYTSYNGLIWDAALFDSAQETGYVPTEVLVYDGAGNVEKRTMYHGTHVIAVNLSENKKDNISILCENLCQKLSHLLWERSIQHPVIFGSSNKNAGLAAYFSLGYYAIYINEKSKNLLFSLGHELGHCNLWYETNRNVLLKDKLDRWKAYISLLTSDAYTETYMIENDIERMTDHLEEFYCDKFAADTLAGNKDEKRLIINQALKKWQKSIQLIGDESYPDYPQCSKRIEYLKLQLDELEKTSE